MNKLLNLSIVSVALFLTACDTDDARIRTPASTTPPPATFNLQVVHAVSDAPTVNVALNGEEAAADVDFKVASGQFVNEATGTYSLTIAANTPDGTATPVLTIDDIPYEATTYNTVFAIGTVATEITEVTISRPREAIAEDIVRATVLHAAAGAPAVDIYVIPDDGMNMPDDDLSGFTPINTDPVAFGDDLGPLDLDAGDYVIRVTVAGDATQEVFNSGFVTLPGGVDAIVAAVDNTTEGSSAPISALLVTATGAAEILDSETEAVVRIEHTISDIGAVDVVVSTVDEDGALVPVGDPIGIDFPDVVPAQVPGGNGVGLDPDDYVIQVFQAENCVLNCGDDTTDPVTPPDTTTLDAGILYDALAQGLAMPGEGQPAAALAYEADDRRRVALTTKLRLIHSSGSTPNVDVYVVDAAVVDITDVDPTLADVPFGANTGFIGLTPGDYNVYVTPAGDKTIAIQALGITLDERGIYTAIARDADTGETGPGLILLDDFTPPAT